MGRRAIWTFNTGTKLETAIGNIYLLRETRNPNTMSYASQQDQSYTSMTWTNCCVFININTYISAIINFSLKVCSREQPFVVLEIRNVLSFSFTVRILTWLWFNKLYFMLHLFRLKSPLPDRWPGDNAKTILSKITYISYNNTLDNNSSLAIKIKTICFSCMHWVWIYSFFTKHIEHCSQMACTR